MADFALKAPEDLLLALLDMPDPALIVQRHMARL